TLFYLEESIDAGDIIAQRSYPIAEQDDIHTLFAKADSASLEMLQDILPKIRAGTAPRIPQNPVLVSRLPRRRPEDGKIDWSRDAVEIYHLVRALKTPYPNAFTFLRGKKVYISDAQLAKGHSGTFGSVTSVGDELIVGAGTGGGKPASRSNRQRSTPHRRPRCSSRQSDALTAHDRQSSSSSSACV
ncbi:MAG: methionyl-tRNA formyltransferase, partial [Gaiellales bacterium]